MSSLKSIKPSYDELKQRVKKLELETKKSNLKMSLQASMLDQVHNAVITIDLYNKILYWNKYAEILYQWKSEEVIGKDIIELLTPEETKDQVLTNFSELNRDGHWEGEFNVLRKDRKTVIAHITTTYLKNNKGENIGFIGISKDISERKRSEKALVESELRFRTIFENAPVLIDAFNKNGKCILWNKHCEETFGWTIGEINSYDDSLALFYPDPVIQAEVMKTVTVKPDPSFREWHPVTKKGNIIDTMWANFTLPDGMTFNLGYDVTQRNKAEKEIRKHNDFLLKMSEEKSILLKEVHHRVKNNLQLITSLIALQAPDNVDIKTEQLYNTIQNRIYSMSMIHEILYQSDNFSSIDIGIYIDNLIGSIGENNDSISFNSNADNCFVNLENATSIGLIVNEIITNSIKHAIGKIEIYSTLHSLNSGAITLKIGDNGIGFNSQDVSKSKTLGLTIIDSQIKQLKGTLEMDDYKQGTNYIIKFNKSNHS